jgi:hypothetical protein
MHVIQWNEIYAAIEVTTDAIEQATYLIEEIVHA